MRLTEETRQKSLNGLLNQDFDAELYGSLAVLHIIAGKDTEKALLKLKRCTEWFEHPHPSGNNLNGESDFVAIRLIPILYEKEGYSRLSEELRTLLQTFYLKKDFKSVYGAENHIIMFRVSRLLAAQFYKGEYFENYKMTAEEIYKADTEFINDFIDYRAGHGFGEFDSLGYTAETLLVLNTLYAYTDNVELKQKARMIMDVIFLDMIADSKDYVYCGAHGRSYPHQVMNSVNSEISKLYAYYFGFKEECPNVISLLSDYVPSEILYEIAENKKYPYENREQKHLHCWSVWVDEIKRQELAKHYGTINKYTYLCEDYVIGAINRQEDYPLDSADKGYAYHQQHNWELVLGGHPSHKIFTHHPGNDGAHNSWTGDMGCRCGVQYANKNTAVCMYNIENPEKRQYIHAYLPNNAFENRISEEKYLFFEYGSLYISFYFSEGYKIESRSGKWFFLDDGFEEVISEGSQHAVVLRVEYKDKYGSLAEFGEYIKKMPVIFDKEAKTVCFDGIELRTDGNSEGGKENGYPYKKLYDCYFMQSMYGSKVIELFSEKQKAVYDFNLNKIIIS